MKSAKLWTRWILVLPGLATLWLLVNYPFQVITGLMAILSFYTAWRLILGRPRRDAEKKGKDRAFRHPPWV
jgi:hypothetical protein